MHPVSWRSRSRFDRSFGDGTSQTMIFAEKRSRCGNGGSQWGRSTEDSWQPTYAAWSLEPFQDQPTMATCNPRLASSSSSGGILVGMADGSARTVPPGILPATWAAAYTPAGGEVLGSDW